MTDEASTPEGVSSRVAEFVCGLAEYGGLTREQAYRLRLATDEIATNVLQHGYRGPGLLDLCGGVEPDRVWVRTEDEAPPFDPRDHDPGPLLAQDPITRAAGGLGLVLALESLDEFEYERVGNRNRITMAVRRGRNGGGGGPGHGAGGRAHG
ncbi:ATP-binding protein [Actinosynnema sp. CA-299493]